MVTPPPRYYNGRAERQWGGGHSRIFGRNNSSMESAAMEVGPGSKSPQPWIASMHRAFYFRRLEIFVGVFALVIGLRLIVLQWASSPSPYVDEWPATAESLLAPWKAGTLSARAWFAPHNGEHRIVATRLWEVFWFELAGEWDPQLVMTADAALMALTAALLAYGAGQGLEPRRRWWAAVCIAVAFAVPFCYSNLLWAFQSQFVFLLLLTVAALLCAFGSSSWWAGAFSAAALLTNGGGAVTGVTIAVVAAWLIFARQRNWREEAPLLMIGGATVAGGLLLRASNAPPAPPASAARAFAQALAWPNSNLLSLVAKASTNPAYMPARLANFPSAETSWVRWLSAQLNGAGMLVVMLYLVCAAVAWWPLAAYSLRLRRPGDRGAYFTFAVGVWSLGIAATIGLARANEVFVGTRFVDCLLMGIVANGLCLLRLWPEWPASGAQRRFAVIWIVVVIGGLGVTAAGIFCQELPRKAAEGRAWTRNVRAYLRSQDPAALAHAQINELPILGTNPDDLRAMLDRPEVRTILPRGVQPTPSHSGLISRGAKVLRASGWLWLGGGVFVLAWDRWRYVWLAKGSEKS